MRIGLLALAFGVALSACTGPPQPGSLTYTTYSYHCCPEITGSDTWHPGQHVTLHWLAETGRTTDTSPHPIVLSVSLTGPFPSVDALKQAITQGSKPAGVRTINAAPISTTDRTLGEPASELDLPSDLPPGYYNLGTQTSSAGLSAGGGAVISVIQ
jgi:hypothetical protein